MSARARAGRSDEGNVEALKSYLHVLRCHLAFFLLAPLVISCRHFRHLREARSVSQCPWERITHRMFCFRAGNNLRDSFLNFASSLFFVSIASTEMNNKETDTNFAPSLLEQSHVFFSSNGGNVNRRKIGKEATLSVEPSQRQQIVFSLQSPAMLDPSQVRSQMPQLVSTGLHLASFEQKNSQIKREQPDSLISAYFQEDIAALINKEKNEIDQHLIAQSERLRRAMAERHQRQYRTLLEAAGGKLLEKEAEIQRAGRCISELEERLSRLQTESMAWQAKAMAEQAAAASLHAQLQRAAVESAAAVAAASAGDEHCGESPAEDAESAYIDPNRSEKPERLCRACLRRPAIVVLLPCCHLCLCVSCDFVAAIGDGCPACGCFRTGSLQVSFA